MAKELRDEFGKKIFTFKGRTIEELKKMPLKEFIKMIPSRERRSFKRGFSHQEEELLNKIRAGKKDFIKTHARDMVIIPEMLDKKIGIYNGKEYVSVTITPEMLGHRLGELTYNRKKVAHTGPGIGATRSSKFISAK